ncbi:glycerophosphodiester phosphodiesterase family protein [Elstera litoralis]|uniref:glycerophosphodiester phosphodiesterase family protein n=1 Tax=Elstera litoralis TaxID=552518 RepID=UPI000696A218|nr:glycerophosphodiester phosphodiesterase family protein [Elstera litoralis]
MVDLGLPPIIGHRGARGLAPENTLAGLRAAFAQDVLYVEIDAKLTADGVVILMHDETLERTTDGRGRVAETPYTVIQGLNAAKSFADWPAEPPPTLNAVLALVQEVGGGINIEIKPCPGRARETAAAVVDIVRTSWRQPSLPLLSSFDRDALDACRDRAPDLPRGYLSERTDVDWVAEAKALAAPRSICPGGRSRRTKFPPLPPPACPCCSGP